LSGAVIELDLRDLRGIQPQRLLRLDRRAVVAAQVLEEPLHERQSGKPYHAALSLRAELSDAPSEEMAVVSTKRLSLEPPGAAAAFRKLLQRAREKFAELLFAEVAASLPTSDLDAVEEELICLDRRRYCRSALRKQRSSQGRADPES
jgi:hypothetical protein